MAFKNARLKVSELNNLIHDKDSCVKRKDRCNRKLFLRPIQLADLKQSIKECLDSEVTTYEEGLGGIILSFKNIQVNVLAVDDPGGILIPVNYIADIYIFKPKTGSVLTGIVSKKSNNHIGCLVHKIFNVTIPCPSKTPVEEWEGNLLNIGDSVTFKIINVDLSGRLPFIKGVLL